MGLLKHVILPFFAAMHMVSFKAQFAVDTWAETLDIEIDNDDNIKDSKLLLHSMGILRAFSITMGVLCMVGVKLESSHFRGILILAESAIFTMAAIDAYLLGLDWIVPGSMAAGAIMGAAVHAKEPGIFTADKNKQTAAAQDKKK